MSEPKQHQHPYVAEETATRTAFEAARTECDDARKRAKDFERPWSANTDARINAERNLTNASAMTPLQDVIQWQAIVNAALFLDARFRTEFEVLLQAQGRAEADYKRARTAHELVVQQISIWRNEQADRQRVNVEAQLDAELRDTRTRRRAELMQVAS